MPQKTIIMLSKQLIENCQESQRETLQAIQFATCLMQLLVTNLTSFQHLKYGKVVVQEKLFEAKEAIMEIIAILVAQAKLKGVALCFSDTEIESETLGVITDADKVIQVLQNVILMAIHFASKESEIEIDCWTERLKIEGLILFKIAFTSK